MNISKAKDKGKSKMIIPIKCFTCGKVIADKYRKYLEKVRELKLSAGVAAATTAAALRFGAAAAAAAAAGDDVFFINSRSHFIYFDICDYYTMD